MSIIQWNCRGITSSAEEIKTLFRDTDTKIMCIQETKLGTRTYNPGLNYNFHKSPPLIGERSQGGTGIIIHKSIKYTEIHLDTVLQACAIQFQIDKKITLCSVYMEPKLEEHLTDNLGNRRQLDIIDLEELIQQLPPTFIILEDFNAKRTLWGNNNNSTWGNIVEELIDKNELILMNDGTPTRHDIYHNTSSTIDLAICSPSIRLDYFWSVNKHLFGSDHWPIQLQYIQNTPSPFLPKWKINEADWKEYHQSSKIDLEYKDFQSPIEAYEHFTNTVNESAGEHIPKSSGTPSRP